MAGAAAVLAAVLVVVVLAAAALAGAAWPAPGPAGGFGRRGLPPLRRAPPCGGCAAPAPGRSASGSGAGSGAGGRPAGRLSWAGSAAGGGGVRVVGLLAAQILEQGAAAGVGRLPAPRACLLPLLVVWVEELELLEVLPLLRAARAGRVADQLLLGVAGGALAADPDAREEGGEQAGQQDDEGDDHLTVGQGDLVVARLVRFSHVGSGSH